MAPPTRPRPVLLEERTDVVGLEFTYDPGSRGALELAEVMGGGAAWFDFDLDGDLDLFLPQAGPLEGATVRAPGATDRLFRNDLGSEGIRLVDVSAAAGLADDDYGMGVAVGDVDGDGWPDLYVTNWGPNRLWRNRGDGTFEDGTGDDVETGWTVSASLSDFDLDGRTDLFAARYVSAVPSLGPDCTTESGVSDYCGPLRFEGLGDLFLRQREDGTFGDMPSVAWPDVQGRGLGIVAVDVDGDLRPEVYVANDGSPNNLWVRGVDGRWEDRALDGGCAVSAHGKPEASMGVAAADVDADGDVDLLVTHLFAETNTLYLNDGRGLFEDATRRAGLGAPSFPMTGFGVAWVDLDHDRDLDLLVANGRVRIPPERESEAQHYPLDQPNQVLLGEGGRWSESHREPAWSESRASRGLAVGDADRDGALDVVVVDAGSPARYFRGRGSALGGWVVFEPTDPQLGSVVGARVEVESASGRAVVWSRRDGSYASSHDPAVHFGLGEDRRVDARIDWPLAGSQRLRSLPAERRVRVGPPR